MDGRFEHLLAEIEKKSVDEIFPLQMLETAEGRRVVLGDEQESESGYAFSNQDTEILNDAKRHMAMARLIDLPVKEISHLHSRWENWSFTLFDKAQKFKSCEEALHFAQVGVPFDHREKWSDKLYDVYGSLLAYEFFRFQDSYLKFGDNPKSVPDTIRVADGIVRSNILFWHLRTLCICKQFVSAQTVAEIGGGYGALARLWMLDNTIKRYVIIDIPESLFFAEVALRDEFGFDHIGYWEGTDPGTQVVLLPVNRINEYEGNVDLVISTGSLQELSDVWINFYMEWLDRCGARFFYSLNYMGQPFDNMFESRTFWAPRPSNRWFSSLINTAPPLVKMMSPGRFFCEILYEKDETRHRQFADWGVFKGDILTRDTYIRGLELLRQDFTPENATKFVDEVIKGNHQLLFSPKEILHIIGLLNNAGIKKFKPLFDRLLSHQMNIGP